jgi:very-short-patch-repair endonuclease
MNDSIVPKKPYYDMEYKDKQSLCSKRTADLKRKQTESEVRVGMLLSQAGVKHKKQKGFIKGDFFCIADFYLPAPYCTVIEVDGGYHETSRQKYRDEIKDRYYEWRRFRVLRISDTKAMSITSDELILMLDTKMLEPRRTKREMIGVSF